MNVCTKIIGPNTNIKMVVESLKIKSKSYYYWDHMVYLDDFNVDLIKIVRQESRIDVDIYYIRYVVNKPQYNINSINPLYLIVRYLFGHVEKIQGSSDRYLVVGENNKEVINVFDKLWKFIKDEINRLIKSNDKITFGNADNKISEYNKLRFSSDVDLPLDNLIEFHMLTIAINCVIEKGNKYEPEIYFMISIDMISIDIKNRLFTLFAKAVNILDFNSKGLSIEKTGSGETCIYYIKYDKDSFYLVIDDLKGYFEQNDDDKYLTMIFTSKSQKMMYTRIWEEI